MNRQNFIKTLLLAGIIAPKAFGENKFSTQNGLIGACDWSIGNRSNLGALEMAKLIGLDGVQISLGLLENDMHLRQKSVQEAYLYLCNIFNVKITGLAIGELNSYPYKADPQTDKWVYDSIEVAKSLKQKVVLLAFFSENGLKNDPKGTEVVVSKFKEVMPEAEKQGITFGIESWLSAEEHMYIIDKVASPNLKVYYDTANSHKMGYDIYKEIVWLGKKGQICEFHFKENGFKLGDGEVDFTRVKKCMDEINYQGNIQIEGATTKDETMLTCYRHNIDFVRKLWS